ncbi:MAG: GNAT family N-acetyltransferase, partial [Enterococcus sp.]|nr:GNAT family N-acetyltransferase [Enterococcus sp.]
MKIQIETKEDFEVVYEVVQTAFKNAEHSDGNEADLVVALRNSLAFVPELSLVAKIQDKVVGHLLLTEIS